MTSLLKIALFATLLASTFTLQAAVAGEDLGLYSAQKNYTIGCDRVMYDHCGEFDDAAVWREFEPEFYQMKREIEATGGFPLEKAWSGEKKFGKLVANISLHFTYAKSPTVKRGAIADKSIATLTIVKSEPDEVVMDLALTTAVHYTLRTYPAQAKEVQVFFDCKDKEGKDRKGICWATPRTMGIIYHEPTGEILRVSF